MSSDSEDDCYGNIAQRLQLMKNQYNEDKIPTKFLTSQDTLNKEDKISECSQTHVELKDDSDCEEISLDTIIAQNSKKRAVRRSKRNADISVDNIIKTGSKRTRNSTKRNKTVDVIAEHSDKSGANDTINLVENTTVNTSSRGRNRGKRGRKGNNSTSLSTSKTNDFTATANELRSRNHGLRGRRSNQTNRAIINHLLSAVYGVPQNYDYNLPTYSVGNTDDYPDDSYNQPLFKSNSNQSKKDEVVVVETNSVEDLNESLDGNEELSVKVYWQNRECIKFNIRRFQQLQTIFDFFANREKVDRNRLFFTYNDKILKKDDTPDSITYNEVKFIDGGIINQQLNIVQDDNRETVKNGIKLKFQCQYSKKPIEVYVKPEEKLAVAMTQCAEHLEKPLEKLKFLFDGDMITGKHTPKELDLEGGECIDVKIIS